METKKSKDFQYKTALVIVVGFIIIFAITAWKYMLWVALIAGVGSLLSSKFLHVFLYAWDKLTLILSKIIPNLLLTIIFYFFLTPVALLSKFLSKKDHLKLKNNSESLFIINEKVITKIDFEKPW